MPWLVVLALVEAVLGTGSKLPVVEVEPHGLGPLGERLVLVVSRPDEVPKDSRLVVAWAGQPLGWFEPLDSGSAGVRFVSRRALDLPAEMPDLRAWLVSSSLVSASREQWPVDAELRARIDAVGLGAASVWVDAGQEHGVITGDCWWQRLNGQPVARYDVRLVGRAVCSCRVVPLAAGLQPACGDSVSLWPPPGRRRTGRATTAVSYVEAAADGQIVWVAAPVRVEVPGEPRLDFYRRGQYVGAGVAERRDARFWYVRTLPAVGRAEIRVGDDAIVRTSADIRDRRFVARLFEPTPGGCLVNAGEVDGLTAGEVGAVHRAGRRIARVQLTKVQRGYSVAKLLVDGGDATTKDAAFAGEPGSERRAAGLQRLDEVRFSAPEAQPHALGVIEQVVDGTLFAARITDVGTVPVLTPLAVRRGGDVIAVAVLLDVTGRRALGFALARSLVASPALGDRLALPS